jgi:hypothetical protein
MYILIYSGEGGGKFKEYFEGGEQDIKLWELLL